MRGQQRQPLLTCHLFHRHGYIQLPPNIGNLPHGYDMIDTLHVVCNLQPEILHLMYLPLSMVWSFSFMATMDEIEGTSDEMGWVAALLLSYHYYSLKSSLHTDPQSAYKCLQALEYASATFL